MGVTGEVLVLLLLGAAVVLLLVLLLRQREVERRLREDLGQSRLETAAAARGQREELAGGLRDLSGSLVGSVGELGRLQENRLQAVTQQLGELTASSETHLAALRDTVDQRLRLLQEDNSREARADAADGRRAPARPRWRSGWASPSSRSASGWRPSTRAWARCRPWRPGWATSSGCSPTSRPGAPGARSSSAASARADAHPRPVRGQRGLQAGQLRSAWSTPSGCRDRMAATTMWSGCPSTPSSRLEDYQRMLDAQDAGRPGRRGRGPQGARERASSLGQGHPGQVPRPAPTTDFGIMFLPTEGLYAEVLRRPGPGGRAPARLSGHRGRPHDPRRPAQQPADGLPHAGHRAALERGVAAAGSGEDPVRAVRGCCSRRCRRSSTRPRTPSTTRPARAAPSSGVCAMWRSCLRSKQRACWGPRQMRRSLRRWTATCPARDRRPPSRAPYSRPWARAQGRAGRLSGHRRRRLMVAGCPRVVALRPACRDR